MTGQLPGPRLVVPGYLRVHHQAGKPPSKLGSRARICTVTHRLCVQRHPVRSSWRPGPSWTHPGDFCRHTERRVGSRQGDIPCAQLRLPSAAPKHGREGIWGPRGFTTPVTTPPLRSLCLLASQRSHRWWDIWGSCGLWAQGSAPPCHTRALGLCTKYGWCYCFWLKFSQVVDRCMVVDLN